MTAPSLRDPFDATSGDALLSAGLPPDAAIALRRAGECYADSGQSEAWLAEAGRLAPEHPAVLIGLYRFYFYKNRLAEAAIVAVRCLVQAARANGLRGDWRTVRPGDAPFGDYGAALARYYMFSLKAYAYLRLRLGDLDEGRDAIAKLLELDSTDKVNARVLHDVLLRAEASDDL